MKRISIFLILWAFVFVAPGFCGDKKPNPPFQSGTGEGGMTYSPTEGWIKTGQMQMRTGTDYLELQNKKKAEAEYEKQLTDRKAALQKAAEDEKKLKAEQEAKLAKADQIIKAQEAKEAKSKKPKTKTSGKRVLIS